MPNIKYQILQADKAGMPALPGLTFDDPQEAAHKAKKLASEMGEKLVVKLIIDPKWKAREQRRLDEGIYRPTSWEPYGWWYQAASYAIHRDQFPHPALERPGFLAYTANEEDGTKDKQTIVRPGAYLKKYFSSIIDRYGYRESDMVDIFMAAYGPSDVKFAVTEEDIIKVYENGPQTCMRSKDWPTDKHPAHIYAAGDLQVAYLGSLEKATARTLVWPEKKIFSRVYGDIARITRGLEKLGYKWGAPIGAKVKKVQIQEVKFNPKRGNVTHCFIAPYIDKKNQAGGGHLSLIDNGGEHLFICEEGIPGSHHCGLADGYSGLYVPRADEYPTFTCEKCHTPGHRGLLSVYNEENPEDCDESSWCPKCARNYAFNCGYSGAYFCEDSIDPTMVEGCPWSPYYAEMYAEKCEMTDAITNTGNIITLYFGDKSKRVSLLWANDNGGYFKSGITNRWFMKKERIIVGGMHIAKSELKHHCFTCDQCFESYFLADRTQEGDKLFCSTCRPLFGPLYQPKSMNKPRSGFKEYQDFGNPFLIQEKQGF